MPGVWCSLLAPRYLRPPCSLRPPLRWTAPPSRWCAPKRPWPATVSKGPKPTWTSQQLTGLQNMDVTVNNAPKNTEFELFVTQQANSPFGVSWYQADFETNNQGHGEVNARGIFGEELFVFAPGSVKAPQVDKFDAKKNPAFKPVHTLHLGLWFGSPQEAKDAGCPDTVTQFDGDHKAGIQAFSTRNFPARKGPLGKITD